MLGGIVLLTQRFQCEYTCVNRYNQIGIFGHSMKGYFDAKFL
jgi:hypothetical protein